MRSWVVLCVGLVLCAGHRTAWPQTAADKAAADALFNEGKRLISQGDYPAACEKFAASSSKVMQFGVQFSLADCYETIGKTASAWGAFSRAATEARKARDKRQRIAEQRAVALAARLSKMVITVTAANRVEGLEIRRDGVTVLPAELDTPIPVDPGEHIVEASAPGRVAWSRKVSIPTAPEIIEVSMPALEKLSTSRVARQTYRTLAVGLGGGGVAVLGASMVLGMMASSTWSDAQPHCRDRVCDPTGVALAERASTLGNASTAMFVVGAAAVGVAAILFLNAPSASAERARSTNPTAIHLVPAIGPAQLGVTLQGGF